ncbi:hypothetical protein CSKR_202376 [Clonorchis sinensis]|uniref:Uncharacterized protein n=1 Tax=Clonorchis sinensis TaxID=79923 RepID=A0A8T1MUC5_CLOSI|nr:hypothetical protein CSKR_202376 [Clonorchis sinensis]
MPLLCPACAAEVFFDCYLGVNFRRECFLRVRVPPAANICPHTHIHCLSVTLFTVFLIGRIGRGSFTIRHLPIYFLLFLTTDFSGYSLGLDRLPHCSILQAENPVSTHYLFSVPRPSCTFGNHFSLLHY